MIYAVNLFLMRSFLFHIHFLYLNYLQGKQLLFDIVGLILVNTLVTGPEE